MKWSNTITLQHPLLDVRLLTKAPVLDWQDHLRESERTSYEQGRLDGERALSEQLLQQRNEMAELQNGVINSLKQMLPQIAREMESALIELALESAKKIVSGVKIDARVVETVVREALTQVQDTSDVSIRLHPEDLALLRKHKSQLLEGLPETGPLRFAASDDVSRGGCIVQTRFGLIDAQRETKLELLRKAVNV
jgi:flagellar biosynthesis/type III secretory pathway protein FliH